MLADRLHLGEEVETGLSADGTRPPFADLLAARHPLRILPRGAPIGDELLLEREAELAALQTLIDAAGDGTGGIALVVGEAGAGKSRLLSEARAHAERLGVRVLTALGSPLGQDVALGVGSQLLGDAGGGPDAVHGFSDRLRQFLGEGCDRSDGGRAVVIVVDDAQWADQQSLRMLAALAVRIERQPVALLMSVLSGEPCAPLAVIDRLRALPWERTLAPAPLSERAVGAMAQAMLGDGPDPQVRAACHRVTRGNPFYVKELLRALACEPASERSAARVSELAPAAVVRSIVVRLGRLGMQASVFAQAVAILGDGASLAHAAALVEFAEPVAESAADVLAGANILQPGEPLRFVHPLIAAALEADMGAFGRARAHRRAADLLIARGAPAERVAAHLAEARPVADAQAVTVLRRAATDALAAGAPAVAVHRLRRALREPPPAEIESDVLLELTHAETMAAEPDAGQRLGSAIERIQPHEQRLAGYLELATLAHHRGDVSRAGELAVLARQELSPGHPRREELLALELCGSVHGAEADPRLEELVGSARAGSPPGETRLLALVIARMSMVDPPSAVRALAEPAIAADPLIDESHGISLGLIAAALTRVDQLELAERWLGDAIHTAERRGVAIPAALATLHRATVRRHLGDLAGALADSQRTGEPSRWVRSSAPERATANIARGAFAAAREALADDADIAPDPFDRALVLEARARLALAEGNPAQAFDDARAASQQLEMHYGRIDPRGWECRRITARAAIELGHRDLACELIEAELQVLRASGPARQLGAAMTIAGLAAGGQEGLDLLTDAAELLTASAARVQQTETLLELGSALRRAGRRRAASGALYAALDLAATTGAAPLQRRADDELHRLGLRPRRTAQTGVASLTPAELRVAEVAASGLTTREIAQRLFVSRNTIETHLRRIYRKLDVSGRAELPAALEAMVS